MEEYSRMQDNDEEDDLIKKYSILPSKRLHAILNHGPHDIIKSLSILYKTRIYLTSLECVVNMLRCIANSNDIVASMERKQSIHMLSLSQHILILKLVAKCIFYLRDDRKNELINRYNSLDNTVLDYEFEYLLLLKKIKSIYYPVHSKINVTDVQSHEITAFFATKVSNLIRFMLFRHCVYYRDPLVKGMSKRLSARQRYCRKLRYKCKSGVFQTRSWDNSPENPLNIRTNGKTATTLLMENTHDICPICKKTVIDERNDFAFLNSCKHLYCVWCAEIHFYFTSFNKIR